MTRLANNLVEAGLKESSGWKEAQERVRVGGSRITRRTRPRNDHSKTGHQSPAFRLGSFAFTINTSTQTTKGQQITLECNYSKKLGLPGYSSHQFAITLRTEIADLARVQAESASPIMSGWTGPILKLVNPVRCDWPAELHLASSKQPVTDMAQPPRRDRTAVVPCW